MTSTESLADTLVEPLPASGAAHAARGAKLGLGMLAFYGVGSLVENVTTPILALLLFYLSVLCGLSGSEAGIVAGVTLVVDSFCDPLVGSLSDNSRSRHGRRHPFMLLALVPIFIAFGLLFSVPQALHGGALFAYALVTLLAARIGLSIFIVPYMGLGAELSDDYAERSTIVAARVLFSVIATLATTILAFRVFLNGPHGQYDRPAYAPLAWTCIGIAVLGGLISTLGTLRARSRLHAAPVDQRSSLARFPLELVEVFRNSSFRWLFITCLIFFVSAGAAGALTLHANSFFWRLKPGQILAVTLCSPVGVFLGVFLAGALSRAMEKRTLAMIGLVLIAIAQMGPVALRLTGVISPEQFVPILGLATGIGGMGASVALIGFQSMMADAADEHEHLFFARREALYFAGITTSAKASSGVGALIAGVALDVIGFPHGAAATGPAAAHIPYETVRNLGLVYGPGAALFTVIAILVLINYKLDRAGHAAIRAELDQRRIAG
jgi:GPH family glycoside/pentoside/hexuronide:cation symporter